MPRTDLNGRTFGQRVKARRVELELTQEDLIALINDEGIEFSQPFLSQIENDKFDPDKIGVAKAMALLFGLDVSLEDLFWG